MTAAGLIRSNATARGLIVAAAALVGVSATARLGCWQLDRAAQKEAQQRSLDSRSALPKLRMADLASTADAAAAQHDRRIDVQGRWLASATVFLENRQMNGRAGFFVVTPLLPADGSTAVLVQRGFTPRDNDDRTRLPTPTASTGESIVRFTGRIAPPPARLYEFAASPPGLIRQNLDPDAFAREIGRPLRPLSIVQDAPAAAGADAPLVPDALQRHWPRPALDVQKHYGYAFQWFALCALTAGLYVRFQIVRPRRWRRVG